MAVYALDGVAPELPEEGRFWIAPNASVIGKVRLERDVSVWFGAVLRGDYEAITVGARTSIQDCCVLHPDIDRPVVVGEGCTVGHGAILHGCTIGPHCLIGMGATILTGALIGADSIIGAGALVPEGHAIPEGVLALGVPAKVVGRLSDEEIERVRQSADYYVDNYRLFASRLVSA